MKIFARENSSGLSIRSLANAIEEEGMMGARCYQLRRSVPVLRNSNHALLHSSYPLMMKNFGGGSEEESDDVLKSLRDFVREIRARNADIPIYLYGGNTHIAPHPQRHSARVARFYSHVRRHA